MSVAPIAQPASDDKPLPPCSSPSESKSQSASPGCEASASDTNAKTATRVSTGCPWHVARSSRARFVARSMLPALSLASASSFFCPGGAGTVSGLTYFCSRHSQLWRMVKGRRSSLQSIDRRRDAAKGSCGSCSSGLHGRPTGRAKRLMQCTKGAVSSSTLPSRFRSWHAT